MGSSTYLQRFKIVHRSITNISAITATSLTLGICVALSGCQLLVDNRVKGNAPVVVVATSEWDEIRAGGVQKDLAASLSKTLASDIAKEIAKKDAVRQMAMAQASQTTSPEPITPARPIIPIEGSEAIQFTNRTASNLAGCRLIGILEIIHNGNIDDAMTLLRNEAFRFNTSILVPTIMNRTQTVGVDPAKITIEARMMECPLRLARGN